MKLTLHFVCLNMDINPIHNIITLFLIWNYFKEYFPKSLCRLNGNLFQFTSFQNFSYTPRYKFHTSTAGRIQLHYGWETRTASTEQNSSVQFSVVQIGSWLRVFLVDHLYIIWNKKSYLPSFSKCTFFFQNCISTVQIANRLATFFQLKSWCLCSLFCNIFTWSYYSPKVIVFYCSAVRCVRFSQAFIRGVNIITISLKSSVQTQANESLFPKWKGMLWIQVTASMRKVYWFGCGKAVWFGVQLRSKKIYCRHGPWRQPTDNYLFN